MDSKYFNDAIIGNSNLVASYTKNGELIRAYYPTRDSKQFIDYFHTGVTINDSQLIYTHDDVNNIYDQYYIENTNILNTEIQNTYFNLAINQMDFVPISKDIIIKQYTFTNKNTIDLDVNFLIHSKLLSNSNEMVSGLVTEEGLIQYAHDYTVAVLSTEEKVMSHQINDSMSNLYSGNIQDKDYIGMSADSSICYKVGVLKPNETKKVDMIVFINDNKQTNNMGKIQEEIARVKKTDIEKEFKQAKAYWKKYVKEHSTINFKLPINKYETKLQNIYIRSILLFPLLTNQATGGVIAALEVDENMTKCGRYAYCWPRDAVFITKALDNLKMEKEAEKFYKIFCKNTQNHDGMWEQRFYTDGTLAPCWGYQIDETASVVHGVYEHYLSTKDEKFLKDTLRMCEKAVKFLKKYLDNIFGGLNKIPVSYDLWEMNEGVHLYSLSSIFSSFEAMLNIYDKVEKDFSDNRIKLENIREERKVLRDYQVKVKKYIVDEFYDNQRKTFVRNAVDKKMDMSILGAVTPFKVFTANEKKVTNTVENINLNLRTFTGGYLRFEDDHYSQGNPWPIATLWMAMYYLEAGKKARARECLKYVVESATEHGYIAEQVNNQTMSAAWVIGLGWSHAMFINVIKGLY